MTADAPLVSAVIPTFNYGRFVTEAVESVLAQTYGPIEVIVVDDGSTDDTRERLAPYMDRIRYIYQPNQGLSAARNTGIRAARGRWIGLLDSDDLWHPQLVETQLRYLAADPEVDLIATTSLGTLRFDGWPPIDETTPCEVQVVSGTKAMVRTRFGASGVLVRRACFEAVGYFDTELRSAEDREMWIRIASRFRVVKLGRRLWWYRVHAGSMSGVAARMELNDLKALRKAFVRVGASCLLRRKVWGYAKKAAAYRYDTAGERAKAIGRVLHSMLSWPFPYPRDERNTRFERPKMLALFSLRLLRSWFAGTGTTVKCATQNQAT